MADVAKKSEKNERQILTAKQVAEEFFEGQVGYQGVLRLTRQGKLPCIKLGKAYLFVRSELERWLKENASTAGWRKVKAA